MKPILRQRRTRRLGKIQAPAVDGDRPLRFGDGERLRFGDGDLLRFGDGDRLRFGDGDLEKIASLRLPSSP